MSDHNAGMHYVYLRRDTRECLAFYPTLAARNAAFELFAVRVNRRLHTMWRVVAGTMSVGELEALREHPRRTGALLTLPTGQQVDAELVARMYEQSRRSEPCYPTADAAA